MTQFLGTMGKEPCPLETPGPLFPGTRVSSGFWETLPSPRAEGV